MGLVPLVRMGIAPPLMGKGGPTEMTQLLIKIAILMFGSQWQTSLSTELGVNERTLRRWIAGAIAIPLGIWDDLVLRLSNKSVEIERMHARLVGLLPNSGKITLTPIPNTKPDVEIDGVYFWLQLPDRGSIRCLARRGIFGDLGLEKTSEMLPLFQKCSDSFYRAASVKFDLVEIESGIIILEPWDVIVVPNPSSQPSRYRDYTLRPVLHQGAWIVEIIETDQRTMPFTALEAAMKEAKTIVDHHYKNSPHTG
jgi:hypothetical protein